MKKLLLSFVSFCIVSSFLHAQVRINEVSSASTTTYLDEDGSQEDWIEFYNTSASPVNLQGYTIARTEGGHTNSWKFPNINIKGHDYLTIFCSQKDRKAYFDHWEVPVYANNPWKYFLGLSEPPSTWRTIAFNDSGWLTAQGPFGYGDGDDTTITPSPLNSIYMRKSFTIADTNIIPTAALLIDYDDAFVAYLNDVEIARSNIGVDGDHPAHDVSAYAEHEATMYSTGNFSGAYFISPAVLSTAKKPGNNVFSIQVHNYSGGMDDLSAIPYLLIGVNDTVSTYFPFPTTVHLHTDFNLSSTGTILTWKDSTGTVLENDTIGAMQLNNTYGRRADGGSNWYYFDTPTPDTTNMTSAYYNGYIAKPSFTLPAGFYTGTQSLGMTSTGGVIRYTTDGKDPSPASPIFSTALSIDSTQVVRARSYSTDPLILPSEIATNTYFINENSTLPVVALTSDPYNLFDYNYGIYVFGPGADTVNIPYQGSNFWKGWERPANIEYFDQAKIQQFETPVALSIQGNYSKAWPQRGFSVQTKENYNGGTINYPLFPDKPGITKYKAFNIRNAGSDWNTTHMRDRYNQKTVQKMHLDIMDGRPCLLFINGKYWGVYELREKEDKNYIASNSTTSSSKIDFLEFDGAVINGSNKGFLDMDNFISTNDMTITANYDSVKNMLDIENFADYFITETYIINIDWLGSYTNNIKFWRPNNPVGKWRYILWDTDLSLGFGSVWGAGRDTTNFLATTINPPTSNPHSRMLKGLLNNTEFKNYFVDRYADMMNTTFLPSKMHTEADKLRDEMLPEMARHFTRWGNQSPAPGFIGRSNNVPEWEANLDTMKMFADTRIGLARNYIQSQFSLVKQVNVGLDVSPAGAGTIALNTLTKDDLPLPWTGVYFDGVPVTMTATAQPGYKFKYWQSNTVVSAPYNSEALTINVNADDDFTAYFEELQDYFAVYPNPFSDQFTATFTIPKSKEASIKIYNVLGQLVAEPLSNASFQSTGMHTITIDANDYSLRDGIYFIVYKTDGLSETVKMVRTKVQ